MQVFLVARYMDAHVLGVRAERKKFYAENYYNEKQNEVNK